MNKFMKRNITLLYFFKIVRNFSLFIPIIVPFYQENGLSQTQIFTLQSLFALTIVFLEVPSGYFADCAGRKRSLLLGAVVSTLGFVLYSVSYGFFPILTAEILLGIGYSFMSGADTAMAYDSFAAEGNEKGYLRFESRSNGFMGMSEATASVIGGFLAMISLRTPIAAEAICYSLTIPLALFLTEPKRIASAVEHPWKNIVRITKYALHGHKEIKWLILYGATMGTLTHTMVWLTQPYYQLVGIPIEWFGILWATQLFMMGLFSHNAERYEKWLGKKSALISFPIIGFISYLTLGLVPSLATIPMLLGFYFVRGVHIPILHHYVNSIVDSDVRATVLSVQNLMQKLLYCLLGPIIGVVVDAYSLQTALLFSAVLYGSLSLIVVVNMRRLKII
ncbi:MAG: MFS transporter [Candidatus Peribacteraceae bacterium]|nr:MFS transporter [Candidatus Peribacteraceae bacterium]